MKTIKINEDELRETIKRHDLPGFMHHSLTDLFFADKDKVADSQTR